MKITSSSKILHEIYLLYNLFLAIVCPDKQSRIGNFLSTTTPYLLRSQLLDGCMKASSRGSYPFAHAQFVRTSASNSLPGRDTRPLGSAYTTTADSAQNHGAQRTWKPVFLREEV